MIAAVTGLDEPDAHVLTKELVEDGQLVVADDVYRLARHGMEW